MTIWQYDNMTIIWQYDNMKKDKMTSKQYDNKTIWQQNKMKTRKYKN